MGKEKGIISTAYSMQRQETLIYKMCIYSDPPFKRIQTTSTLLILCVYYAFFPEHCNYVAKIIKWQDVYVPIM